MSNDAPVVPDIRTASEEEYWDVFAKQWSGLISYRYIGRQNKVLDSGVEGKESSDFEVIRLRHDMRNPSGGIMAAPLCIASPEAGGMQDDNFIPNPVIASMQILDDARGVKEIATRSETIRLGRTTGYSRTEIYDADNPERVIALSSGMGISLGATPDGFYKVDVPPIEVEDSPSLPPLHKVFGAIRREDGTWTLPELSPDKASPDGALHLGPIHVVLEAAAMELADAASPGVPLQMADWHVMFVARGKVGPFAVVGKAVPAQDGRVGVTVTLHDEGNDNRPVSSGSASFRPAATA